MHLVRRSSARTTLALPDAALLTLTLTSDAATDIRHIAKLPSRSRAAAVGVRCAADAADSRRTAAAATVAAIAAVCRPSSAALQHSLIIL